jgi:hypothetical protein
MSPSALAVIVDWTTQSARRVAASCRTETESWLQTGRSARILQCWIGRDRRKRMIDPEQPVVDVRFWGGQI